MKAEAIQELENLTLRTVDKALTETVAYTSGKSYIHKVDVSEHGRKLGAVIEPFRPAKLEVTTLTGFVDGIKSGIVGDPTGTGKVIHIQSHLVVSVKSAVCDDYGVRDTLLTATYQPLEVFAFDTYYDDPQKFIIKFQQAFHLNDPDGTYLLRLASNLKAGVEVSTNDDGINQTVKVKTGEIKTAEVSLKPRLKLLPRTTFDEAAPVEREFLVRLKESPSGMPSIAIFAVDGNKWKGEAMVAIKSYLSKELGGWQILA